MKKTDRPFIYSDGKAVALRETKKVPVSFSSGTGDDFCEWIIKNKLVGPSAVILSANPEEDIADMMRRYPSAEFVGINVYRPLDLRELYGILCTRGEVAIIAYEDMTLDRMCSELGVPNSGDKLCMIENLYTALEGRGVLVAYNTLHPASVTDEVEEEVEED